MGFRCIAGGIGAMLAILAAVPAVAATATPEQAGTIKAALERYVGHGADGAPGPVSVTPEGDHYRIAIDLKQALHALDAFGLTVQAATYAFTATPTGDSLWRIADASMPRLTVNNGENSYSVVFNGSNFEGSFDPALPGFRSSAFSYDSMSLATVGPQAGTQTRQIAHGRQTTMSTPTGDGTAMVQMTQSSDGFSQDFRPDAAASTSTAPNMDKFTVASASTSGSVAIDDLHTRSLSDIWAFLVAHPDEASIKASREDLRAILRKALPLFDHLSQTGNAEHLAVDSPFGRFAADELGGQIRLAGLVADGQVESEVHFSGVAIPQGLVPAWAEGLLPTSGSIRQRFAGFHLDTAARQAIDAFDFDAKDPWSPEVLDRMKTSLGPLDQMIVTLSPSHLVSRLMSVDVDGDVTLRQPVPDFHVNLRASGLDETLRELQAANDPTASQVVAVLVLAKGLGKAEPDGKLSWALTRNERGDITVNGLVLPGSPGK